MKTALIVATAAGMATLAHGQNDFTCATGCQECDGPGLYDCMVCIGAGRLTDDDADGFGFCYLEECGCEEMHVRFCNHDDGEGSGRCESCIQNCQDDGLPVLGVQSCEFFCSGTDSYGSYGSYGSHVAPPACLRDCSNFDRISTGEVDDCAITSSWVEDSCVSDCYGEDLAALDFFVDDFCAAAEPNCGEDNDSLVFEICRNSEGCPVELFRTCEAVRDADASGNPGNCYDFALQQPGNPDGIQPCPETCGCPCRSDPTKCRTDGDDCWGPRYEPRECADGYFAAVDWHKGEGYGELLCFEPRCEYEAYDRGDECQPQDAKCRTYGDDCWGASSEPRDCADDFVAGIDWDDDKLLCFPPGCEPYDKGMPTCMQCDAHKDRQLQFARLPCC